VKKLKTVLYFCTVPWQLFEIETKQILNSYKSIIYKDTHYWWIYR
jgi:hypothetical protein